MDLIPMVRKCSTVRYFFIFSGLGRAMAKMSSVIQCEYIPSIAKSSFFQAVSDSYLHRRPPQNTEHLQSYKIGSWTLHLRTLHLRMLYFRQFIFGQLNLRAVTPSEISPSGCFIFGMFHLRDGSPLEVSPSESYIFGLFTFGRFQKLLSCIFAKL